MSEPNVVIVFCPVSDEKEAATLAQALVQREEAACVNVIPQVRSLYRWKGKIHNENEHLLLIKTTQPLLEDVKKTIKELHSYELPEILAVSVSDGDRNSLSWIGSSVKGGRENF